MCVSWGERGADLCHKRKSSVKLKKNKQNQSLVTVIVPPADVNICNSVKLTYQTAASLRGSDDNYICVG